MFTACFSTNQSSAQNQLPANQRQARFQLQPIRVLRANPTACYAQSAVSARTPNLAISAIPSLLSNDTLYNHSIFGSQRVNFSLLHSHLDLNSAQIFCNIDLRLCSTCVPLDLLPLLACSFHLFSYLLSRLLLRGHLGLIPLWPSLHLQHLLDCLLYTSPSPRDS